MKAQMAEARYHLTIFNYPQTSVIPKICHLIYQFEDINLIASLSTLPFVVERTYSSQESEELHEKLTLLKVGHRFQSDTPGDMAPSFDPQSARTESAKATPKKIEPPSAVRRSKKLPIILIAAVLLGLTMLVFIRSSKDKVEVATPILKENYEAKIESLERDVEYRIKEDLVWKKAPKELRLQSDDSLRTFQDSTASLRYQEGSRVLVHPNTLMIIGRSATSNRKTIQLEDGLLQARLNASKEPQYLSIKTSSGVLDIESPKPGESTEPREVKLETSIKKGSLIVSVTSGKVVLTPIAKDAAPVTIETLQQVTATKESVSAPVAFVPSIYLKTPIADQTLSIDPQNNSSIVFSWESIGEVANYELFISTDPQMKEVLLHQKSNQPKMELSYLDFGTLYWQVKGTSDNVNYTSSVWRIHVKKHHE